MTSSETPCFLASSPVGRGIERSATAADLTGEVFVTVNDEVVKPTIWFDVEDLLQYGAVHHRPSGIQRLSFQIYQAFKDIDSSGFRIGFVRHAPESQFRLVEWAEIRGLFDTVEQGATIVGASSDLEDARAVAAVAAGSRGSPSPRRWFDELRHLSRRLPERIRYPALQFVLLQLSALRALGATTRAIVRQNLPGRPRPAPGPTAPSRDLKPATEPSTDILLGKVARWGDVLASIGSPWGDEDYAARLAHVKSRLGLQVALLVYDMIPIKRPEWCHRGIIRVFRTFYSNVLPIADTVFAISHSTANDISEWCRRTDLTLRAAPMVVPVGSGFGTWTQDQPGRIAALGLPSRYVLFVSTIEIRKNHALLFRVWRRLLDTMAFEAVPELVFVGAQGWLTRNFMQQLENARFLNGKIRIIHNLSDEDLVAVYRGCMFTVFPSFYEGWGLPVTESLRFGKPCLAAGVSSIPEAGGTLARYFDPGCVDEAARMIRSAIDDEQDLAAWTRRVKDEFRPVAWTETARYMEAALRTGQPLQDRVAS